MMMLSEEEEEDQQLLQLLADEWIVGLAQDWFNPREQRRFASTCRRFHRLIPQPLRIQICSVRTGGNMDCCRLGGGGDKKEEQEQDSLFVSRVVAVAAKAKAKSETKDAFASSPPPPPPQSARSSSTYSVSVPPPLDASSQLEYHTPYYFWKFDYQEQCPVFLGRQLRQTQPRRPVVGGGNTTTTSTMEYRFTLGFRPRSPNQYWNILPAAAAAATTTVINNHNNNNNNDISNDRNDEDDDEESHQDTMITPTGTSKEQEGAARVTRIILPGQPLQLAVSGWDTRPGQADSTEIHKLTARVRPTHSGRPIWAWHTTRVVVDADNGDDGNDDDHQQQQHTTDLSFAYTTSHLVRRPRPESELFLLFPSSSSSSISSSPPPQQLPSYAHRRRNKRSSVGSRSSNDNNLVTQTFPVETYAIPEISDRGAYLLYSPRRRGRGRASSSSPWRPIISRHDVGDSDDKTNTTRPTPTTTTGTFRSDNGRSAIVEFSFWSTHGILYFKAFCLPFALAIPIVQLDREFFTNSNNANNANNANNNNDNDDDDDWLDPRARPILHLFDSFSARWGCIKYYMATAADVGEGCPLQMDAFLRGITDHDDHQVLVSYHHHHHHDDDYHHHGDHHHPHPHPHYRPHQAADDSSPKVVSIVMTKRKSTKNTASTVGRVKDDSSNNHEQSNENENENENDDDDNDDDNNTNDPYSTVDQQLVPDIPRDDSQRWTFFFSW